jgi:hypothetical protein
MSEGIQRGLIRWGLLAAMLCVGLAAWTGFASGRDVFASHTYCIFTIPAIALVCGVCWLTFRIVRAKRA